MRTSTVGLTTMRIILLGSPGAGKGTQAQFVSERFGIPQISTGDMLRAEIKSGSAFGRSISARMDSGQLIDDATVLRLVDQRLREPDCQQGYLLDGFPRNIAQAESLLSSSRSFDAVLEIAIDDETVVQRMSGRRVHLSSGRTYHVEFNPPREPDLDDVSGEPLVQRPDDEADTVRARLEVYHAETRPLLGYLERRSEEAGMFRYVRIDGTQSVAAISGEIEAALTRCPACA